MTSIELTAPAKVNLFLKVLNKRKDSYHDILTLFERISLADKIILSKACSGISLISDTYITASPRENIAYKAAALLTKKSGLKSGVNIRIEKNIPIAAGLGGGSSDAAAVLTGMNRLFGLKFKNDELMRLGQTLGADVPFFILDTSFALGRGKGERLDVINSKSSFWHLLIYPGFHISTKEIYDAFDRSSLGFARDSSKIVEAPKGLTTDCRGVKIPSPLEVSMDFGVVDAIACNDLEKIAISKRTVIGSIIRRLASSLGKKAIVSGSGPSVFCLFRTRKEAVEAKGIFLSRTPVPERRRWRIFVVKTR